MPAPAPVSSFATRLRRVVASSGDAVAAALTGRRYAVATSALVLVAIVTTTVFGTFRGDSFLAGFSRLIIPTAYALENFELRPEQADSLGVDPSGAYILTSKASIDEQLVRENLRVTPDVPVTVTALSATSWRIAPTSPLPAGTVVRMALATSSIDENGDRRERDYAWAFQVADTFRVLRTVPRDRATGVPSEAGIEVTFPTDGVSIEDFSRHFSLSPKVPGTVEKHGRTLVFVPTAGLSASVVYTATVSKGLTATGSDTALAEDMTFQFETQRPPQASGRSSFSVNPTADASTLAAPELQVYSDAGTLSVAAYAFASPEAYLAALQARDALPWWSSARAEHRVDVRGLTKVTEFSSTPTSQGYAQILRFPEKLRAGWYLVELRRGDDLTRQTFLQVTDVAVYATATATRGVAWANDLAAKGPIVGATIEVPGLGKLGTTAADGTATFATPADFSPTENREANRSWYAIVRAGNRAAVLQLAGTDYGFFNYYGDPSNIGESYWRYLSTDRPRYQPSDTLQVFGVVRERQGLAVPEKVELTLAKEGSFDYWYRPVTLLRAEVAPDRFGGFQASMALENLAPDYYTLELRVNDSVIERRFIWVEAYEKPAYAVSLAADRAILFPGETANVVATAAFFEGTPVPNLELRGSDNVVLQPSAVRTDGAGQAAFTYAFGQARTHSYIEHIDIGVQPTQIESGSAGFAATTVRQFPSRVYVRSSIAYPEKGVAQVDGYVRQVDRAGLLLGQEREWGEDTYGQQPVAGARVQAEVMKTTYVRTETGTWYDFVSKRSYKTYRFNQKQETVDRPVLTADERGHVTLRLSVEPDAQYIVKLTATDAQGQAFESDQWLGYYDGYGVQNIGTDRPYYNLTEASEAAQPDGQRYAVGDELVVRYRNNDEVLPSSAQPSFLFLQLQNGLQEVATTNVPEYRFDFEQRDVPNVTLTGVWFSGSSYVSADFLAHYDHRLAQLSVEVTADKRTYAPGENAKLDVRVTDRSGRPVSADVNVKLVDEAYYAVANEEVSPVALYNYVSPGIWFSAYTHRPAADGFGGAEKGGGGANEFRSNFKDVALFTVVRTGLDGRASASVKLPDNITTWRATTQAVSDELGYGVQIAKLPVTKPAFVAPVVPPEVLVADRPVVAVRAYGNGLSANAPVEFAVTAPFLAQPLTLSGRAFARVTAELGNVPAGTQQVGYRMTSGKLEDGVRLPLVSLVSRLSAREVLADVPATTDTRLPAAQGQAIEVVLADAGQNAWYLPLVGVAGGYGTRPDQIAATRIARALLGEYYQEISEDAPLPTSTDGGGFAPVEWGSADIALSAMLADVAPDQVASGGLLQHFVSHAEGKASSLHEVAEGLHGLASLGEPVLLATQSLLQRDDLDPADRLALALALERLGDREGARKVYVQVMEDHAVTSAGKIAVRMEGPSETTRATAMALLLASRLDLPELEGLRGYLLDSGKGYPSTLELAGAAAADLPRLAPKPAAAEIAFGGRTERLTFTGSKAHTVLVPAQLAADFRITKVEGDVRVLTIGVRALAESELVSSSGLSVERRYFVGGKETAVFGEGDLVEVRLYPRVPAGEGASMVITDLLPSGLVASNWHNTASPCQVYGQADGQRVTMGAYLPSGCGHLSYFARVRGLGSFRAEPALLQSTDDTGRRAYSAATDVTIR